MPRCVDCGTETPREEMFGPPDELRCRACVQRRFPTTNVPMPHRSTFFLRWPPVTTFVVAAAVILTLLYWSHVNLVERWLFADPEEIWDGQLWRLLTAAFLHLNLIHLGFDLWFTWYFGKATERWMGSLRFAAFFVATAVASSAGEVLAGRSGAGLSGVGYALFGFLYALRHDEEFAAELMTPRVVQMLVFWFFLCIGLTYMHIMEIANVAHGVGAVIGWLFGRAVLARRPALAAVNVSLFCVALALLTLYMPWNGDYDLHRGFAAAERRDYAGAAKWFGLAADRLTGPNQTVARNNVEWAKQMMERKKEQ
jgi:membrane associated rhomboid family serine protease